MAQKGTGEANSLSESRPYNLVCLAEKENEMNQQIAYKQCWFLYM